MSGGREKSNMYFYKRTPLDEVLKRDNKMFAKKEKFEKAFC